MKLKKRHHIIGGDSDKTDMKETITKDVTEGLKKVKQRKQVQKTMTAKERFDILKSYMKTTLDQISSSKNLESIMKALSAAPFNFDQQIDEFYKIKIMFYVNDFKGDIVAMFESVKKDISSMLEGTEWTKKTLPCHLV